MTESPQAATVPQWTLGDRMRKAREHAGLKQSELAEDIGIARSSITNYEGGRTRPSRPVLMAWAMRTGVPLDWLAGSHFPPRRGGHIINNGFLRGVTWAVPAALGLAA